jgi:hypothetical protein
MIGAGLAVASNGAMAIVRSVGEGPGRQDEGHQNEQLISISERILQLTKTIHELTVAHTASAGT